jgi:CHAT domain-containing protein/Tfp pilus assembly protein PilF
VTFFRLWCSRSRNGLLTAGFWLGCSLALPAAGGIPDADDTPELIARGVANRQQGQLRLAIDALELARSRARTPAQERQAAGELGMALMQARRLSEAEAPLLAAYRPAQGLERARYAAHLGQWSQSLGHLQQAEAYYREALQLAGEDVDVRWSIELNRLRLLPEQDRVARINVLSVALDQTGEKPEVVRHHLNLGHQASELGKPALRLAYHHLDRARQLAVTHGLARLQAETLDALAQLYENRGRIADALSLTTQESRQVDTLPPAQAADLRISLEWRRGRLLKARGAQGDVAAALAAYRRAVEQIDAVRQDIPVEYADGRSSYRSLFEPVYTTYADLLLRQIDTLAPAQAQAQLQQVVQTLELIRQTELQDFLGDRCATEAVQGGTSRALPVATAVLYPLILKERMELLLVSNQGIVRQRVAVSGVDLRDEANAYAASLRRGLPDTRGSARRLNDWLLAPLAATLSEQRVERLIVVPDGPIRLVPIAALHDGTRYAIEKFAISMVTGMSMTNASDPPQARIAALVAGLAQPGPVVDKLGPRLAAQVLSPDEPVTLVNRGLAQHSSLRAIRTLRTLRTLEVRAKADAAEEGTAVAASAPEPQELQALRERLALPGVRDEVQGLGGILAGQRLLDGEFTVDRFSQAVTSGDYRLLHIASHGIFGGNAQTSFIMAYDDVLDMDALQHLLKSEKFQKTPIELLSLSACQTAEGNDRAPLGISGAAIKARAKSVLGTLWPVEDNAAKNLMQQLYKGLTQDRFGKAEALRQAQLKLLRDPATQHPFYWAPFVLIGNWL